MELGDLSDQDRLILGLRFRLKHVRLAIAVVEAGRVPEGFEFTPDEARDVMLAELRRLEIEVLGMLRSYGADGGGLLN